MYTGTRKRYFLDLISTMRKKAANAAIPVIKNASPIMPELDGLSCRLRKIADWFAT
jgi:hypothetical protein